MAAVPAACADIGSEFNDVPAVLLKEYGWEGDVKRGDKSPFRTRQGPSPSSKTLTTEGNVGEPSATFLVCLDDRNEDITAATGAVVA
jgi:hypothetical protein